MSETIPDAIGLDERYLDFTAKTNSVFQKFPEIEPLRHFIFKDLVIRRTRLGRTGLLKHWLRPLLRRARTQGPLNRADVLVWIESTRETSAGTLLPVYRELVSRRMSVQLVAFRGPDNLPQSTVHFQFPAHAFPPIWAKQSWNALCDVVEELRCPSLKRHFIYASANVQALFDEMNQVLTAIQPKIVLTAVTQIEGGAALVVSSRSHGAMTLVLQHGILQPFYVPVMGDYMLTWGESSNETLVQLGVSRQKLMALGSPRHDSMNRKAGSSTRTELLRVLSLPERPTLVFFSNGNDLDRNGAAPVECAKWLESTAAQLSKELNVIVRLHPNEDGLIYRNCPHLSITKDVPSLQVTLDGADIVGSLCSTALYEALLFRKPVLQFHADKWPLLADNWRQGLAVRVACREELTKTLRALLSEGATGYADETRIGHVFANRDRSATAIADFVVRQLQKSQQAA